jgi:methylase of polypeptide subunit release factors
MNIHVRPGVFIPRWETEEWACALATRLRHLSPSRHAFTLVDLCTGSGCIPLFLKGYLAADIDKTLHLTYGIPNYLARFVGVDHSSAAIDVARRNLRHYQSPDQKFPDSYDSVGTLY